MHPLQRSDDDPTDCTNHCTYEVQGYREDQDELRYLVQCLIRVLGSGRQGDYSEHSTETNASVYYLNALHGLFQQKEGEYCCEDWDKVLDHHD